MAWLAVDKNGEEWIYSIQPIRDFKNCIWYALKSDFCQLPLGSIKSLIGSELTWDDEPVKMEE